MAATDIGAGAVLGDGGRYRLERVLGTGGMAVVWQATDTRLQRPVAVKVLSDVLALDRDYVRRFAREARVAAGLSHPHLVRIYDFSADSPRPYLVLEFIAGGTLADRLRQPPTAGWDPWGLGAGLLGAIAYIHAAGIIHRDIKPANVLIGSDGQARLTDFGIAQPVDATRMTRTGDVIGTGRYLAPEVLAGGPANARSDLYSFGVLLRECLAPDAPEDQHRLVARLTDPDPSGRPASAAEALELMTRSRDPLADTAPTRLAGGEPTLPLPSPQPSGTGTARTRLLPGGSARERGAGSRQPAVGAAEAATRVRTAVRAPVPPRSQAAAVRRRAPVESRRAWVAALLGLVVVVLVIVVVASSGSGSHAGATPKLHATPVGAPIAVQLTSIDNAIDHARR